MLFPPAFVLGAIAIVLSVVLRQRIKASGGRLRGTAVLWVAMVLGVVGCLLSLVFPAVIVYGLVYALFHGGQLPAGG